MPHIHLDNEDTYDFDYVIGWRKEIHVDDIMFFENLNGYKAKELKTICKNIGCSQSYQGTTSKFIMINNIIAKKLYGVKTTAVLKCEPENLIMEIALKLENHNHQWVHWEDIDHDLNINISYIEPHNPIRN